MQDQEKNFDLDKSCDGGDAFNVENNSTLNEGNKDISEDVSPEEDTAFSKEENNEKQEKSDFEEDSYDNKVDDACDKSSAECVWNSEAGSSVYHFKPDNMKEYVGRRGADGTYEYSVPSSDESKKKRPKGGRALWIVIPIVAILALALGALGGFLVSRMVFDSETGINNHTIDITKNDGSIDVRVDIGSTGEKNLSRPEVVARVSDAVVEVSTSTVKTDSIFGNYVTSGAGSGVVFAQTDDYAFIVTNYHVISGASSISITTTEGVELEAEYLDGDSSMDIAMLRVKTDIEFPKIVCGSSDSLRVGDDVLAIGNPLGELGGTVTEGIVSALGRQVNIEGAEMTLLQTSAAVNPGNSGGGLFNMAGELVGIVNAKESAAGIEGLGFAIPIDTIFDSLVEIVENDYIHGRPTLGIEVEYVTSIWEARSKYRVNTTGVFITSSTNDILVAKDLLYSIDGKLITDDISYASAISSLEIGETVTVQLYREGIAKTVEVEVVEYVPSGIFG